MIYLALQGASQGITTEQSEVVIPSEITLTLNPSY